MLQRQLQLAQAAVVVLDCATIALSAASMPSGFRTRKTSLLIAASMLKPLIEMQRAAPWFVRAP
jgi:hypothetical protein